MSSPYSVIASICHFSHADGPLGGKGFSLPCSLPPFCPRSSCPHPTFWPCVLVLTFICKFSCCASACKHLALHLPWWTDVLTYLPPIDRDRMRQAWGQSHLCPDHPFAFPLPPPILPLPPCLAIACAFSQAGRGQGQTSQPPGMLASLQTLPGAMAMPCACILCPFCFCLALLYPMAPIAFMSGTGRDRQDWSKGGTPHTCPGKLLGLRGKGHESMAVWHQCVSYILLGRISVACFVHLPSMCVQAKILYNPL